MGVEEPLDNGGVYVAGSHCAGGTKALWTIGSLVKWVWC